LVGCLEFNVLFQHKYSYIRDEYDVFHRLTSQSLMHCEGHISVQPFSWIFSCRSDSIWLTTGTCWKLHV